MTRHVSKAGPDAKQLRINYKIIFVRWFGSPWVNSSDSMLVTDVGDKTCWTILPAFGWWCPTLILKDRGCWWQKRPKPSPTSQSCNQHISSPTSVTNVDVADSTFFTVNLLHVSIWARSRIVTDIKSNFLNVNNRLYQCNRTFFIKYDIYLTISKIINSIFSWSSKAQVSQIWIREEFI